MLVSGRVYFQNDSNPLYDTANRLRNVQYPSLFASNVSESVSTSFFVFFSLPWNGNSADLPHSFLLSYSLRDSEFLSYASKCFLIGPKFGRKLYFLYMFGERFSSITSVMFYTRVVGVSHTHPLAPPRLPPFELNFNG